MPPLKEAPSTNRRQEDEFDGDNVGVEVNQPERSLVRQDKIGHQRPHDYPQCQEITQARYTLGLTILQGWRRKKGFNEGLLK